MSTADIRISQYDSFHADTAIIGDLAAEDSSVSHLQSDTLSNTRGGTDAGVAITDGDQNSLYGTNAGKTLTTGVRNTLIGANSGLAIASNSISNSCLGVGTLENSFGGGDNIAIGIQSMSNNGMVSSTADGAQNVAIGTEALQNNDGGADCIAIGHNTMKGNPDVGVNTGSNNVAIGADALIANTSGADNIAVGINAGNTLTTGGSNTIIGYNAQVDAVDRESCIILGVGATVSDDNQIGLGGITAVAQVAASTHSIPCRIGGVTYHILMTNVAP